jgi:hypothetical protein
LCLIRAVGLAARGRYSSPSGEGRSDETDDGLREVGRMRPLLRRCGRGRADPSDSPGRIDGVNLGLRDRGAGPDRTRDYLRPSRLRPVRRRTGALDVHAYDRRRGDPGVFADPLPSWSVPAPGPRSL